MQVTEFGGEDDSADNVLGKDGYLRKTTLQKARRTPQQNTVTGTAGSKGKNYVVNTPLKSFDGIRNCDIAKSKN